ncbi:hypothetical protein [Pseudomonas sp. OV546]|uniref:hypothetical protein n=1 Tax=Pseudomonas sp. OV546 TaxID=1881063 RepID=UPI0008EB733C|nr:hypothetical protein [Pseudomonas sp. OV546]SFV12803.1 hypothetical protein SAMN05428951_119103 [Pseudomonas sp. OV546]
MSWYKTGTVTVTPGSNAVLGAGTSFIANSRVGDAFRGPDGEWYEVTNIASNTALSISPSYQGAAVSSGGYSIAPMQGYVKDSADALRAATQVIASGVADMQEQVAAATEAAESAGQSKDVATEQAGIASSAADLSTENKDAAQLAAQQSGSSAQASVAAADRAEGARDSSIQSEQASAASAAAAKNSADHAEEVTLGKAASGDNNDITSLRGLTQDGFDRLRQGILAFVGATASASGAKGLVPAPSIADRLKVLSGAGVWVNLPASSWGGITGALADQVDLKNALDAKQSITAAPFTKSYTSGQTAWTAGGLLNFNPGFEPTLIQFECVVITAQGNAAAGDRFEPGMMLTSSYNGLQVVSKSASAVGVRCGASMIKVFSAASGDQITPANCRIIMRAWA